MTLLSGDQECLCVSMLWGVSVQGRQLSCHWRQMFECWRRRPQIAFCNDPIDHAGMAAAIRYCSVRLLGTLQTEKKRKRFEFVVRGWMDHHLYWCCSGFDMCVSSNQSRKQMTTEQACWWWYALAWILFDCPAFSLLHATRFMSLPYGVNWWKVLKTFTSGLLLHVWPVRPAPTALLRLVSKLNK